MSCLEGRNVTRTIWDTVTVLPGGGLRDVERDRRLPLTLSSQWSRSFTTATVATSAMVGERERPGTEQWKGRDLVGGGDSRTGLHGERLAVISVIDPLASRVPLAARGGLDGLDTEAVGGELGSIRGDRQRWDAAPRQAHIAGPLSSSSDSPP
jgi:hypothetical protein